MSHLKGSMGVDKRRCPRTIQAKQAIKVPAWKTNVNMRPHFSKVQPAYSQGGLLLQSRPIEPRRQARRIRIGKIVRSGAERVRENWNPVPKAGGRFDDYRLARPRPQAEPKVIPLCPESPVIHDDGRSGQ